MHFCRSVWFILIFNAFLTKYMYLSYLPCIKKFGLPPSVSQPVNDEDCLLWYRLERGVHLFFLFKFRLTSTLIDRLVGLVVRRPPRERKIPGSNPACAGIFSGSSHTSDLKTGTPVATLPDAWRYMVSTGTGRPDVSILWLREVERLICNFCLSVAARKIVWTDPSLRHTSLLLGR